MRRIIDQAFCDRARRLAAVHPLQDVAAILRVNPSQITRIKKRGWRAATHDRLRRARPNDFQVRQAELSFTELVAHYRCGNVTLMRWFAELGRRVRAGAATSFAPSSAAAMSASIGSPIGSQPKTARGGCSPLLASRGYADG